MEFDSETCVNYLIFPFQNIFLDLVNQEWNLSTRNGPFTFYAQNNFQNIFQNIFQNNFRNILFSCESGPWCWYNLLTRDYYISKIC